MKLSRLLFMLPAILALSCSKVHEPTPVTDPFPFPESYTAAMDLSVKPGDSFYDYCNGAWLAAHPIPSDPSVNLGRLYNESEEAMEQRLEQLKTSVPDLGHVFSLMEKIHTQPDVERAYISAQKALMTRPKDKDEAFRQIGRLYRDGLNVGISTIPVWDKGKLAITLVPPFSFPIPTAQELEQMDLRPLETKAGEVSPIALVAEGIGIDPSAIVTENGMDLLWETIYAQTSIEDLYQMMLNAWRLYEAFADEAGLAAYNAAASQYTQLSLQKLVETVRGELNYTLSYYLQQQFIPQSLKDKYLGLTQEIQASFRKRIQAVDWMSETTRQNALEKLDNISLYVAFPDQWHKDCIPVLADCQSMAEALQRLKAGNARLLAALAGTDELFSYLITTEGLSSNGSTMYMDLTLINAAYMPNYNSVAIYPAMLMPPVMPEEGVSEACYYSVFTFIAHEFTHGFDNQGSRYDLYGKEKNWWTVADLMAFQDRKENLIRSYSNLELDPVRAPLFFCDGERTQGENIADLGGFHIALDAYIARLDQQGFTGEARKEQLRKFYESFAHLWCIQYGQEKFDVLKKSDVHSHARLRINGVVMNTDLWYELYDVTRENLLYLPKERRAYIW